MRKKQFLTLSTSSSSAGVSGNIFRLAAQSGADSTLLANSSFLENAQTFPAWIQITQRIKFIICMTNLPLHIPWTLNHILIIIIIIQYISHKLGTLVTRIIIWLTLWGFFPSVQTAYLTSFCGLQLNLRQICAVLKLTKLIFLLPQFTCMTL